MIPHDKALIALHWFLKTYSDFEDDYILYLLSVTEYLLTHNAFMFDGAQYVQTTGASMGAKFSPSLANVYMAWWEHCFLYTDNNPLLATTSWYGRYIDDLLFVAVIDVAAIQAFDTFLNDNPCNLQFTVNFDKNSVPFLR